MSSLQTSKCIGSAREMFCDSMRAHWWPGTQLETTAIYDQAWEKVGHFATHCGRDVVSTLLNPIGAARRLWEHGEAEHSVTSVGVLPALSPHAPLHELLMIDVKQRLRLGDWPVGSRMPTEAELSEE